MDLQDELRNHLGHTANSMQPAPADLAKVRATAQKNGRRRAAGLGVVVVLGLGAAALGTARLLNDADADTTVVVAGPADDEETATSTTTASTVPPAAVEASGPSLVWSEAAIDTQFGGDITWTGDRYLAFRFVRNQPDQPAELLSSSDGTKWDVVSSLPESGMPVMTGTDGDHIAVYTVSDDGELSTAEAATIWRSSDGGQTWDSLEAPSKPDAVQSQYVNEAFSPMSLAINGETIILSGQYFPNFDIPAIMVDQGLAASLDEAMAAFPSYEFGPDSITFTVEESRTTLTFDELGLTAEEAGIFDFDSVDGLVMRSTGEEFVEVPELSGSFTQVVVSDSGFTAVVSGPESKVLVSPDGLVWTADGPFAEPGQVFTGGNAIAYVPHDDRRPTQLSRDGGATWTDVDLPGHPMEIALGPAGILVVSDPSFPGGGFEGQGPDDFSGDIVVEKDGFRVTLGDTVTVEDIASGELIVEFNEEQSNADEPPEGVVVDESTMDITFLDPESGEPLVTLTGEDLGFDESVSDVAVTEPGNPPSMEVSFSADGTNWSTLNLEDELGFSGFPRFAVGDNEVVGLISAWFEDEQRIIVGTPTG